METDANSSVGVGTPPRVELQSMADFMIESNEKAAAAALLAQPPPEPRSQNQPPTKKQKKIVDLNVLATEASAVEEMDEVNWIGKLNEYRSAHPPAGLTYTESTIPQNPPRFTCLVSLRETPLYFGGTSISFGNKKTAKHYASKKAIDWLIGNGFMPKDGSVKFPKTVVNQLPKASKKSPLSSQVTSLASASISSNPQDQQPKKTFTSQVPELCIRLGFDMPKYELTKVVENAALWDGYAHFMGDPRIEGKVGVVSGIYGQKNAKEMIAEELVSFLRSIEKHRLEQMELNEDERKRKRVYEEEDPDAGYEDC